MMQAPIPKRRSAVLPYDPTAQPRARERRHSPVSGKLTEIITHDSDLTSMPLLMPLLAQLSRDDRWFAWVAPPARLPKALLTDAGIDLGKVILLHADAEHSVFELARRALSAGTCHAVMSWPGYLSAHELEALERAAATGHSHGILIRKRQHA